MKTWPVTKITLMAIALAVLLSITGCASTVPPSLIEELQTQAQIKDTTIPTHLTDLGILRYGEKVLSAWGLRSQDSDALNTGGTIALAGLSTAALATAGSGASPDAVRGIIAAGNFLLAALGIIKPAARNDARHEGAGMILDARGVFLEGLAAKKVYHISNVRFTPQGAAYFRQIGAAIKVVDKLMIGLAPRIEDLQDVKPTPVAQQVGAAWDPGPDKP